MKKQIVNNEQLTSHIITKAKSPHYIQVYKTWSIKREIMALHLLQDLKNKLKMTISKLTSKFQHHDLNRCDVKFF
jgi:hypothetical protein